MVSAESSIISNGDCSACFYSHSIVYRLMPIQKLVLQLLLSIHPGLCQLHLFKIISQGQVCHFPEVQISVEIHLLTLLDLHSESIRQ